ncbi:unnamed protein product [Arabis nemorensis]|uniref:Uncharacterized protein n=1 Tax=Arabis nemorensis TaxID=586526 RepID=A0A565BHW8_9BRAS|nr:unnamed protein product [Arabis nemorensis]
MVPGKKPTLQLRKREGGKVVDPVSSLYEWLQQKTVRIQGFPLILQLLAYQSIPHLLSRVPKCKDMTSLLKTVATELPHQTVLNLNHVWVAENDKSLIVEPMMQLDTNRGDLWEDEVRTKKTAYLVQLVRDGYNFKKEIWPGGDNSLPLHIYKPRNPGKLQRKLEEFLSTPQTSNDDLRIQFQQFVTSTTLTIKELERRLAKLERCSRSRQSFGVEPIVDEAFGNATFHDDWDRYGPTHQIVSEINLGKDEVCSHKNGQHSENSNEGRGIPSEMFDEADNVTPMAVVETDVVDTLPAYDYECVMVSTPDGKIFVEQHAENSTRFTDTVVDFMVKSSTLVDVAPGVDTREEAQEPHPIVSENSTKDDAFQIEKFYRAMC